MYTQQLVDYIKKQLEAGQSKKDITAGLLANNWTQEDIDEAFAAISNPNQIPQPVEQQRISQLPSASAILKEAFNVYGKRTLILMGIAFVPELIIIVLSFLLRITGVFTTLLIYFTPSIFSVTRVTTTNLMICGVVLIFYFLIAVILQAWGSAALLYAIKDSEEKIGLVEAYRRGRKKIFPLFWTSLLLTSVIFGGAVLFVIPAFIFLVWFYLTPFILIAEDTKGMTALLKSREYSRGIWGSLLWRIFFIVLVIILAGLIVFIGFGSLSFLLRDVPYASQIIANTISTLFSLYFAPLAMIYLFVLYTNVRMLKGEIDIKPDRKKKLFIFGVAALGLLAIIICLASMFVKVREARKEIEGIWKENLQLKQDYQNFIENGDSDRRYDLSHISFELSIYHQKNNVYPETLELLKPSYGSLNLTDPKTKVSYEYYPLENGQSYRLCCWKHDKTKKCITPETRDILYSDFRDF